MRALRRGLGVLAVDIFDVGVVGIVGITDFVFGISDFGFVSWDVVGSYVVLCWILLQRCPRWVLYLLLPRGGFGSCGFANEGRIAVFVKECLRVRLWDFLEHLYCLLEMKCMARCARYGLLVSQTMRKRFCACFISSTSFCDFAGNEET